MDLKNILFSALLLLMAFSQAEGKVPDIFSQQRNAVVTIFVDDAKGRHIDSSAGFIVAPEGMIVTTCRPLGKWVSEAESTLSVEMEGKVVVPVDEVVSSRCQNNLALLRVKVGSLPAVRIARDFKPMRGGEVFVVKPPKERGTSVSSAKIRSVGDGKGSFQISSIASPEESGSPLFNTKGEAIGAVIAQKQRGKYVNFAVLVKGIAKQLDWYVNPKKMMENSISPPKAEKVPEKPERKAEELRDYYAKGCALDQSNMYRDAVEAYKQSLRTNPDFVDAYINLGVDYYRLGRYDDAIDVFRQAIRTKPDVVAAYTKLGATYIVKGEYPSAIDVLKKAVDIDSGNATAHFNLGIAYFLGGDETSAEGECTILKDLDKTKADSLIDLMD